jgi:site-specific DNA recombinase
MNPSALIYCRVSTAGQEADGTSLDTQEAACRAYAEQHGYAIGPVFREVYSGAEVFDRPELNRLRDAIRTGRYAAVIVYAIDRLTRAQGVTGYLLMEFERHGATLISVTDPLEETPAGRFILSAKEFAAEIEREKIAERSRRGKAALAAQGKLCHGSFSLYGYSIDPLTRCRVIYEPEAQVVRRIFRDAAAGVSRRAIARALTAEGVPLRAAGKITYREEAAKQNRSPCGAWAHQSVKGILANPSYKGVTSYLGQTLDATVTPALVSAGQWEAAQSRPGAGGPTGADATRNEQRPRLLRGLITCSRCGSRMRPDYKAGRNPRTGQTYPGHDYYRCSSAAMARGRCGAHSARADLVEHWVWAQIEALLRDPTRIAAEIERQRSAGPDVQAEEERAAAEQQIVALDRQQANLVDLAAQGDAMPLDVISAKLTTLSKQRAVCQSAAERATARIAQAEHSRQELVSLARYVERVARKLTRFGFEEKRLALEALGARVVADGKAWRLDCAVDLSQGVLATPWTRR